MTALVRAESYSRDQIDLIKRTFAVDTTDDEFALFMQTTKRLGLDIFARQAYCVKRWNRQAGAFVAQTQVSIDGFRVIAERTGAYEGQTAPMWCGEDGAWREVWTSREAPAAARVGVYRKGHREPLYGVALYAEFCQRGRDQKPTPMWASMPTAMLLKCAESQALRKAFPQDLAGVYTEEELGQADNDVHIHQAAAQERATADEQAKRRMEADQLALEWEELLHTYQTPGDLSSFLEFQGYQIRALHPNAKSRLWTRIRKTCDRVGLSQTDAQDIIKNAPEYPSEESGE